MLKRCITAAVFALTGLNVAVAPASAQPYPSTRGFSADISGWTVGALAFGMVEGAAPAASQFHDKSRVGPGLVLSGLGEGVALRPWTAGGGDGGLSGSRATGSGLLLDVPLGSFTFTPSFGAVRGESLSLSGAPVLSLRSQFEVGYHFDNASRLSLGYSRISGVGDAGDRNDGDVLSLSYRLPFSTLLDW